MAHSSRGYGSTDQRSDVPDVGFSPTELYSLSENITTNIYTINSSWRTLDRAFKTIGTNKDSQGLRDKVHVTQLSTNQVVTQTSKDIARLTVLMRKGDKEQKLQIEKLTTDFKDAMHRYSEMQKVRKLLRKVMQDTRAKPLQVFMMVAEKMKLHLLVSANDSENQLANENQDSETLVQIQADNESRAVQRSLEFEQGLLVEREERIRRIEGDILDVNQIMRELGALVHQQGDTINTIENSIENVCGNVELGAQELIKADSYQSKFRRKVCFLLLLAVVAAVILTVILVIKLRSPSKIITSNIIVSQKGS